MRICGVTPLTEVIPAPERSLRPWQQEQHRSMLLDFRPVDKDQTHMAVFESMAAFNNGRPCLALTPFLRQHGMVCAMDRAQRGLETLSPGGLSPIVEISGVIRRRTLESANLALRCLRVRLSIITGCMKHPCARVVVVDQDSEAPTRAWPAKTMFEFAGH